MNNGLYYNIIIKNIFEIFFNFSFSKNFGKKIKRIFKNSNIFSSHITKHIKHLKITIYRNIIFIKVWFLNCIVYFFSLIGISINSMMSNIICVIILLSFDYIVNFFIFFVIWQLLLLALFSFSLSLLLVLL